MVFNYQSGAINLEINPRLVDVQGNDLYPMLARLPKNLISQTAIKWNADCGGQTSSGEAITDAATSDSTPGAIVPASQAIGASRFRHTFTVQTTRMAEAAANGEEALADLLMVASRNAMRKLNRDIATNIYAGTGNAASGGVIGLSQLGVTVVGDLSTDIYATIDPATYPTWTNYVNTAVANRALTEDLMFLMSEEIISGATSGVPSNYTAIYTTPKLATAYKKLFQATSDFNVSPNGQADLGYSGMSFEGRPIFVDPYCTADTMYFVDESEVALYTFSENQFAYGDEMPSEGIAYKIVELARTNPDAVQFAVVTKAQLVVARRPAVAILGKVEPA